MDIFSSSRQTAESRRSLFLPQVLFLTLMLGLWITTPTAAQQTGQDESLPLLKEWKGDFDGMAKRHEIRALGSADCTEIANR